MRVLFACSSVVLACSGGNFVVPEAQDTGTTPDVAIDSGAADGTPSDADALADAPADTPVTCAKLDPTAKTLYVDGRATGEEIGTAECPAKTIRGALAIAAALPTAPRTIKVAGGSGGVPLVYDEAGAIVVKSGITVVGDDAARVVVTGGGPCGLAGFSADCVFHLEGNSALEGVTVNAKGARIGVAAAPGFLQTSALRKSVLTGTVGDKLASVLAAGIGVVEIGPDVRVQKNGAPGVISTATRLRVVTPFGATPSRFDENQIGILVQGGTLDIDGAFANRNATHGVAILSATKDVHQIVNLTARDNTQFGVFVEGGASLRMRRSTLLKNRIGLVFTFGPTNTLDLGKTGFDVGKNVFGTKDVTNGRAAICLPLARAEKSPAQGNAWTACSPSDAVLVAGSGCESIPSGGYKDVYYNASGSMPLEIGECEVGI